MRSTTTTIQDEWTYRYQERLGILCGDREPTEQERAIATAEADQAVKMIEVTKNEH